MNRYTIPCTQEQTKKALELGAPLHVITCNTEVQTKVIRTIAGGKNKHKYTLIDNFQKPGDYWCKLISNPTAEEMIGWLEERLPLGKDICIEGDFTGHWNYFLGTEDGNQRLESRKEATLAAIDAALEYLSNNKK